MASKKIGEILVAQGATDAAAVERGLAVQKQRRIKLGRILVATRAITEEQLTRALAAQSGMSLARIGASTSDATARALPLEIARRRDAVVVGYRLIEGQSILLVAVADPFDEEGMSEVRAVVRQRVRFALAPVDAIRGAVAGRQAVEGARLAGPGGSPPLAAAALDKLFAAEPRGQGACPTPAQGPNGTGDGGADVPEGVSAEEFELESGSHADALASYGSQAEAPAEGVEIPAADEFHLESGAESSLSLSTPAFVEGLPVMEEQSAAATDDDMSVLVSVEEEAPTVELSESEVESEVAVTVDDAGSQNVDDAAVDSAWSDVSSPAAVAGLAEAQAAEPLPFDVSEGEEVLSNQELATEPAPEGEPPLAVVEDQSYLKAGSPLGLDQPMPEAVFEPPLGEGFDASAVGEPAPEAQVADEADAEFLHAVPGGESEVSFEGVAESLASAPEETEPAGAVAHVEPAPFDLDAFGYVPETEPTEDVESSAPEISAPSDGVPEEGGEPVFDPTQAFFDNLYRAAVGDEEAIAVLGMPPERLCAAILRSLLERGILSPEDILGALS